jgi:ketosteroid isomerase-like protein
MNTLKAPSMSLSSPDEAEQHFYEALQQGDLERFLAVWSDDEEVTCVHPGGPRLIRASFGEMFNSGPVDVRAEKVYRLQTHFTAVHSVLECVQVLTEQGRQTAWVISTNVYLKTTLGWRIVAHHASPGTPREAQEILESAAVLH